MIKSSEVKLCKDCDYFSLKDGVGECRCPAALFGKPLIDPVSGVIRSKRSPNEMRVMQDFCGWNAKFWRETCDVTLAKKIHEYCKESKRAVVAITFSSHEDATRWLSDKPYPITTRVYGGKDVR